MAPMDNFEDSMVIIVSGNFRLRRRWWPPRTSPRARRDPLSTVFWMELLLKQLNTWRWMSWQPTMAMRPFGRPLTPGFQTSCSMTTWLSHSRRCFSSVLEKVNPWQPGPHGSKIPSLAAGGRSMSSFPQRLEAGSFFISQAWRRIREP